MKLTEYKIKKAILAAVFTILVVIPCCMIYIHVARQTVVLIDGKEITLHSGINTKVALQKALELEALKLNTSDIVLPPNRWFFSPKTTFRVVRVMEKVIQVKEPPRYEVLSRDTKVGNLRPAELQKVKVSRNVKEVSIIYHDGLERECRVLQERTVTENIYRLLLFKKDTTLDTMYDLSKCKKIKMIATAYYPGDPLAWRDGTITYLGEKMERGIVAVDPAVIPLRTRVYVPGYGYGYAGDTGSAIKGKRIDLGVNNAEEEKDFMHKRVIVYILEKSKAW